MIDPIVAYDKLAGFEGADDIAKFLKSQGILGRMGDADKCPIAQWMQQQTGMKVRVFMGPDDEGVQWGQVIANEDGEHRPLTQAMSEFVGCFDEGQYPGLSDGVVMRCSHDTYDG